MIVANKKAHGNKLKNKIKTVSYKKRINISSEPMELETVIFQYTLDAKTTAHSRSFYGCVQELQNSLNKLTQLTTLAKDAKFLRMCAILITELYYKAKNYPFPPRIKKSAKQAIELLTTPFQTTTLIQAARLFSEQNPKESDLSIIFTQLSADRMEFLNQFGFKMTSDCLV